MTNYVCNMFVVILSNTIICKQVCVLHCFVFVAFVYNFIVKQCKRKTPVFRFFIFVTICFIFELENTRIYWINSICFTTIKISLFFFNVSIYLFFYVFYDFELLRILTIFFLMFDDLMFYLSGSYDCDG